MRSFSVLLVIPRTSGMDASEPLPLLDLWVNLEVHLGERGHNDTAALHNNRCRRTPKALLCYTVCGLMFWATENPKISQMCGWGHVSRLSKQPQVFITTLPCCVYISHSMTTSQPTPQQEKEVEGKMCVRIREGDSESLKGVSLQWAEETGHSLSLTTAAMCPM